MTIVTVVETPEFQPRARAIMSEDERLALIDHVARHPLSGVPLGGGVRKFRFARDGGSKSGGYRVVRFYGADENTPIFLITVFAKHEKANLSKTETKTVKALGKVLAETYRSKT